MGKQCEDAIDEEEDLSKDGSCSLSERDSINENDDLKMY